MYFFFFLLLLRLWDIECGACLRVLEGHEELVRCIRFDSKRIVSGAYDGKIKVWDLVAALDPRAQSNSLCLNTLVVRFTLNHIESSFMLSLINLIILGTHWSRFPTAV